MLLSGLGGVLRPPRNAASKRCCASFSLNRSSFLVGRAMLEFDPEDKWPMPEYITGPPKHVHALGVISLNFNLFEALWATLLNHYAGPATASFLFSGKISDEERVATIRHYAKTYEREPKFVARIEEVANAYSICAENRHILMHSHQFFSRNHMDRLSLRKLTKSGNVLKFHFDLATIRRVADEINAGYQYLIAIVEYLLWRSESERDIVAPNYAPLPEKFQQPRKLDQAGILEAP